MNEILPPITDEEAREILSRFIASHFRKHDREHARFRIPADPAHDDDLRMSQYISETAALRSALAEAERERDEAYRCLNTIPNGHGGCAKDHSSRLAEFTNCWICKTIAAESERDRLREALNAADSILWMAREYAEAGGSGGPEMVDFTAAEQAVRAALSAPLPADAGGGKEKTK